MSTQLKYRQDPNSGRMETRNIKNWTFASSVYRPSFSITWSENRTCQSGFMITA